jgi:DNA-binding transcriptional ArsR family regulator
VKPLIHPDITDVPVELVLHALADPVRVAIFADIIQQDCSQMCSSFLMVGSRAVPKSTLSQHFKVLREAGLIRSERRGVEVHNTSRCAEVDARYPGMLAAIMNAHNVQLADEARREKAARRKAK